MATNEREQPKKSQFPIDRPDGQAPRREPPPSRAPTDPDIARQGRVEATSEDQAIVDAANGEKNISVEGP